MSRYNSRLLILLAGLGFWLYLWGNVMAAGATAVSASNHNHEQLQQVVTPTLTITPTATATPLPLLINTVEPNRMSTINGGVLTVLGQGFTPDAVVRLVGYGLLNTSFVNPSGLTAVVPPGVPPGRYDVQVSLGDIGGVSTTKPEALRIEAPPEPTHTPAPTHTPVPTATPSPTPTAAFIFGQPQLTIQSVRTNPTTLVPGERFEMRLTIVNQGNWTAVDASLEMQSPDLAVPDSGSNVRVLSRLAPNEVITTSLSLIVSETAPHGPQNLSFQVTYFDINGRSYGGPQSVGLFIGEGQPTPTPTPGAAQPLILLTTYAIEPATSLQPGSLFDLVLTLSNPGEVAADTVMVRLGGQGGQALEPFVLLNSGNVRFLETVAPGQTVQVTQQMMVVGTAAAGVYTLPIDFIYRDGQGEEQTESQVINLMVERAPLLQVNFYRPPELGRVGQPLNLPVEVVNIGRSLINVSNITLSNPDTPIENNSVYIGPLDGGTSGSLDGLIVPTGGGELPITITINYLDEFNQPQQYETTLTVMVEEPTPRPDAPVETAVDATADSESEGFLALLWRFIRGILGLGS